MYESYMVVIPYVTKTINWRFWEANSGVQNRIFALLSVFTDREKRLQGSKIWRKVLEEAYFANESRSTSVEREACRARRSSLVSKKTHRNALPTTFCEAKSVVK